MYASSTWAWWVVHVLKQLIVGGQSYLIFSLKISFRWLSRWMKSTIFFMVPLICRTHKTHNLQMAFHVCWVITYCCCRSHKLISIELLFKVTNEYRCRRRQWSMHIYLRNIYAAFNKGQRKRAKRRVEPWKHYAKHTRTHTHNPCDVYAVCSICINWILQLKFSHEELNISKQIDKSSVLCEWSVCVGIWIDSIRYDFVSFKNLFQNNAINWYF